MYAVGLQLYLNETPSQVSFKDFGKFSSTFMWYIREWKIMHFIGHLVGFFVGFKRILAADRSSCLEVWRKKGVLKAFAKFGGKRLHESLFFNKVAAWKPESFPKKRLQYMCFPVNLAKFRKTSIFCIFHSWSWKRDFP